MTRTIRRQTNTVKRRIKGAKMGWLPLPHAGPTDTHFGLSPGFEGGEGSARQREKNISKSFSV